MLDKDMLVKPGQKVRVVQTVEIAFDVDIADYLEETGETDISPRELEVDIEDNTNIRDTLDLFDNTDITVIKVEVTEIR